MSKKHAKSTQKKYAAVRNLTVKAALRSWRCFSITTAPYYRMMHKLTQIFCAPMIILVATALMTPRFSYANEPNKDVLKENEFSQLYDCTQKLHQVTKNPNIDYDLEFLAKDLFYILDRRTPEAYIFTPYYAGKADLSLFVTKAVKAELDKNAQQVKDQSFPFTPCCQDGITYNIAIPYMPDEPLQEKGYFYLNITDSSPGMYDEVYWVREEKKMHIKRHGEPFMKTTTQHDARNTGIVRFLPGPMQTMPDFTNYKPKETKNGVTITSVTGQINKGVEYHPLVIEEKLWDKKAQGNFSADARNMLIAQIRDALPRLSPIHKIGQQSDCWGHAGCDYTYTAEEVAREQKSHDEAINSCRVVAEDNGNPPPPQR